VQFATKIVVAFALVACASAIQPLGEEDYQFLFTKWIEEHSKTYETDAFFYRYGIFKNNLDFIREHNDGNHSYQVGMNQFGDLTTEEFGELYTGYNHVQSDFIKSLNTEDLSAVEVADSLDWEAKGAVTPVKNQGQCGSCWAFSTTGSTEGANFLKNGELISLSEQQLVDCAGSYGNQGCNGGLMDYGFEYIIAKGSCKESDYAYKGTDGSCKTSCSPAVHLTGYKDVSAGSETDLMKAVQSGPVSVAIEADQSGFQFYTSGVFDGNCGKQLDHGVLLVGYGSDSGKDYWRVKNSWGESWGDKGYIRMIRGQDQCGIADSASYPVA
jgi:C1A family cysteine protease